MDFTREPIIETVITPREGYRLVVRSSKGAGSEEHFVDALEVVSFGSGIFFRSLERPKPFIVPVADYEVLEVREPRMVLKTPGEQNAKAPIQRLKAVDPQKAEAARELARGEAARDTAARENVPQEGVAAPIGTDGKPERGVDRNDKRRDRRRGFRRRRGGKDDAGRPEGSSDEGSQEGMQEAGIEGMPGSEQDQGQELGQAPMRAASGASEGTSKVPSSTPMLSSILPPPTMLIRDDLKRLREDYKGAFYINDEKDEMEGDDDDASLANLGTTSEEEMSFREEPYAVSEEDIRMNEGADAEVPPEGSFRPSALKEEANSSSAQDV